MKRIVILIMVPGTWKAPTPIPMSRNWIPEGCFKVFLVFGQTSAPHSGLLVELSLTNAPITAPLYNNDIRTLGIACPRHALMKTRRRNWPAETDAEIRAFVLGFETRRQSRAPHMRRVHGHFVKKLKILQKQ